MGKKRLYRSAQARSQITQFLVFNNFPHYPKAQKRIKSLLIGKFCKFVVIYKTTTRTTFLNFTFHIKGTPFKLKKRLYRSAQARSQITQFSVFKNFLNF